MLENGKITELRDKGSLDTLMGQCIQDSGLTTSSTVEANNFHLTDRFMMDITKMGRSMGRVPIHFGISLTIVADGRMIR